MLDSLTLPPRMVAQALSDLHDLAQGLRRLTESDADVADLLGAVRELPRIEDELAANIASLQGDVQRLQNSLTPLIERVADLDQTAEKLEVALGALHEEIRDLRKRIPGI